MPAGLVTFMRTNLQWDVLFVIEHDDLRRARDGEHYRLARQLRRTLITLDRDYLDDRKFPPRESGGVLVLTAPEQKGLAVLLARLGPANCFGGPDPRLPRCSRPRRCRSRGASSTSTSTGRATQSGSVMCDL